MNEVSSSYESVYHDLYRPALVIAGCFVLVALVLSIFLILQHLKSYTNPAVINYFLYIYNADFSYYI